MFHELLVALSGTPGAIFKMNEDNDSLEMTSNLPFVHPSETELLNKICRLGGYYRCFETFIDRYSVDVTPVDKILYKAGKEEVKDLRGQYLHAFCAGLSIVLQPYQQTLINIEDQVMRDDHLPLSIVHQGLEDYFFIFPSISNIIKKIQDKKVHGCQILELLHETSNCGITPVKKAVEKILHTCHSVLYKQLSAWLLHGLLADHYHEFFIADKTKEKRRNSSKDEVDSTTNTILRGTNADLEELQLDDQEGVKREQEGRVFIVPAMLPSYIPLRVAEKILFIGQSVQMLKDTENLKAYHYSDKGSNILQGREKEFLKTLYELQKQPHLSIPALEAEIDLIKSCVAEQLWRLVVEEAGLVKHLKLLKEMYLLGRGELYLTFIDHASTIMKGPPNSSLAYDVNTTFKQSLAKILAYSEEHESLFSMTLQFEESAGGTSDTIKRPTLSNWDHLRLNYNPPWCLHLIFTPPVMEKYNTLFSFLVYVRRVQIELQNVWCLQMTAQRSNQMGQQSTLWSLRARMAFFVDNLQYYLQVDVLESQFALLLEKIKRLKDFESISMSHETFLISMLQQCFTTMKPVLTILHKVLDVCLKFCALLSVNTSHWNEIETDLTEQLALDFGRQTALLFKILSSVRSHQTSPHLAQLMLRIDFNKFFTRSNDSVE